MARTLNIKVTLRRLRLSPAARHVLHHLDRYDLIAFTSKHARRFFHDALKEYGIKAPRARALTVGPRSDLLAFDIKNKHILFPRSAIAPSDILRRLRKRGATVRTLRLYTARGARLSPAERLALEQGAITSLHFRSPSGVAGFVSQLRGKTRARARAIPVLCIGETTARAARHAGFSHVSVAGIL